MTNTEKPRYQHDCQACRFLGQYNNFDLYWCKSQSLPTLDSVLARYGSDGPEYISSHPPGAFSGQPSQSPWYVEILKRAETANLYDPKTSGTRYQVIVGNIGTVFDQREMALEAVSTYDRYVEKSKAGDGRAAGESVFLMAGGELIKDYSPEEIPD